MYKEITREEAQVLHSLRLPFYFTRHRRAGPVEKWNYKWTTCPMILLSIPDFYVLEGEKICD